MDQEITPEVLSKLDIQSLALNRERFGEITFDRILPFFEKLHKIFAEFAELQYKKVLLSEHIDQINDHRDRFLEFLRRLQAFRLSEGFNKDIRDGFENEVEGLYKEVFQSDLNWLTFLRQQVATQSRDTRKLQEEQKAIAKILSDLRTSL